MWGIDSGIGDGIESHKLIGFKNVSIENRDSRITTSKSLCLVYVKMMAYTITILRCPYLILHFIYL